MIIGLMIYDMRLNVLLPYLCVCLHLFCVDLFAHTSQHILISHSPFMCLISLYLVVGTGWVLLVILVTILSSRLKRWSWDFEVVFILIQSGSQCRAFCITLNNLIRDPQPFCTSKNSTHVKIRFYEPIFIK